MAKPKHPKRRTCWFWRCVLAIQLSAYTDATARRSVAHLTITNAKKLVWYNEGVALRYDI
ncbi:MAG: hypothetical protein LBQ66_13685 [Planctomycetaceae bacterium]|nr:hypothetical protein [Planctomycetaceae bacterium]